VPWSKDEISGLIGILFHDCRTREKYLQALVLQGKRKNSSREEPPGVIKGFYQKRFRRIAFYGVMS
jgi:hypothetical protein